ncbi:hypothetical protein [Gordonia aichiensis]|uniref:Uncharacterized protein n=1 Tax=Gordonia aichiensis NBRC 108223 TaxID=1220583 RepID=L7KJQ4_9ACTN|nr:hypothetical protein [Gordonia aichiensis]GAC49095.1 hypothetical protein GOACH_10_00630 [Gordonia aichiensis NBRC 108223]
MTFSTIAVLAAQQPQGPEFGKASPIGLLVIVVLLIGTALLIRSMNKQLRRLPKSFDANHPEADQAFDEGTDAAGAGVAESSSPEDGVSVTADTNADHDSRRESDHP